MLSQASGLSRYLGAVLTVFAPLPMSAMALLIALLISVFTEITSNSAVINVVTPIIIAMVWSTYDDDDDDIRLIALDKMQGCLHR